VINHLPADQTVEVLKLEGARYVGAGVYSEPFDTRTKVGWVRLAALDPNRPSANIKLNMKFAFGEAFAEGPATGESAWDTLQRIYNYVAEEVFLRRFVPYFS